VTPPVVTPPVVTPPVVTPPVVTPPVVTPPVVTPPVVTPPVVTPPVVTPPVVTPPVVTPPVVTPTPTPSSTVLPVEILQPANVSPLVVLTPGLSVLAGGVRMPAPPVQVVEVVPPVVYVPPVYPRKQDRH
jgi:hypothetical protein